MHRKHNKENRPDTNSNQFMKHHLRLLLLALAATGAACCSDAAKQETRPVESVILITADGFSADVMRAHPGAFPRLEALAARGISTLEARSVLPSSSAINWATLLMGAGPEMHGFTDWGSRTPEAEPVATNEYGLFPGIFGEIRRQMPRAVTGAFYSWDGIGYLYEQPAATMNFHSEGDDRLLAQEACRFLTEQRPDFAFICFAQPDGAGHTFGWESDEYLAMCRTIDSLAGAVVECIDRTFDPERTAVIFTSDHGGTGLGHGGKTMHEMQVPYMLVAPGIPAGTAFVREVMKYDNAPTVLELLGLEVPALWRGKSLLERLPKQEKTAEEKQVR